MRTCMSLLPHRHARLVTQHDGFAYLNDRYGTAVVGPRARGASVGRRLWADALGEPGTPAGSYLGAMAANTDTIVRGLTHGRGNCLPEP
jgi:ABC-type Zn uptake system ZnuABC Zn-binding protein ZnuA